MISPLRRGGAPTPGIPTKVKTKLWLMAGGFVLLVALFLGILLAGRTGSNQGSGIAGGYGAGHDPIDVAASVDEEGRPKFSYQAKTPQEKRDLALDEQQTKLTEFFEAGKIKDSVPADDPEVLAWLIDRSIHEWRVTRVPESLYVRLPEDKVLFEPGPHRGAFASAFGQIVEIPPATPFAGKVDQVEKLYRAVFRTEDGNFYDIVQTVPIDREVGDWIQVYGIFYRTRPYPKGGEGKLSLSLVVVKDIQRAYPPITVTEIDPAWASEIMERSFEQANNTDERPLWLLLNFVRNMGIDGYRERRDSGEIQVTMVPEGGTLARDLSRLPDEYRFKYVAAMGKIIDPYPDILMTDNPGKIKRVDSAVLLQSTEYLVRLVSPRPWSEFDFREGQEYVRVEGIFYKRWMYVPQGGGPAREIPLLVVTDVIPEDRGGESILLPIIQWVLAGLAVGLVVLFLGLSLRDRRRLAAFRGRASDRKTDKGE